MNTKDLTEAQRQALRMLARNNKDAEGWERLAEQARPLFMGDGAIVLDWCGMLIGIEPDGYTHS